MGQHSSPIASFPAVVSTARHRKFPLTASKKWSCESEGRVKAIFVERDRAPKKPGERPGARQQVGEYPRNLVELAHAP